jgi:hypothetical protein
MNMKEGELFYVEWEDSYGCSARWEPVSGVEPQVLVCRSVGWLTHKEKNLIVLVPHLAMENGAAERQGCGDMTIPAASILRIIRLPALPVSGLREGRGSDAFRRLRRVRIAQNSRRL